ncbi:MAG: MBL fold metallo-hydrolase [Bradymonadales bacterium]|jgi:hydroxyacylglutathione hydrolase
MGKNLEYSLQFLGSGNAWSKPPVNFNNNVLLEVSGLRYLIDCGNLCPLALHVRGISLGDIDGVCVTHLHGDHINGLEELLFYNYFYLGCRRIELCSPRGLFTRYSGIEGEDLWENCLRGTFEFRREGGERVGLEEFVNLRLLSEKERFTIGELALSYFAVEHVPGKPCYGIEFDDRIVYTSDCVFSPLMLEEFFNKGVQLVFHDVSFERPTQFGVHCCFEELMTLPREMAERIVLMHFGDATTSQQFAKALDYGFRLAECGQRFNFKADLGETNDSM